jgi:hypothetical protein
MTDPKLLLELHKPRLVYDSMEAYFADSAAIWTDFKYTQLNRAGGTVVAPQLSLAFLGAKAYADGKPVGANDTIGETTRDYRAHAAAAHANVRYRNRVHGRAKHDDQGRLWLQYWCFYYYNDLPARRPFSAGDHEGDWEMIQLLLDADERPLQGLAQHASARRSRGARSGRRRLGGHAARVRRPRLARRLFHPGSHWTGVWFDNADGKGRRSIPRSSCSATTSRAGRSGRALGRRAKSTGSPIDATSPKARRAMGMGQPRRARGRRRPRRSGRRSRHRPRSPRRRASTSAARAIARLSLRGA